MEIRFNKKSEKYGCFSNFYPCMVEFNGIKYKNSEAAWQSQKTIIKKERLIFTDMDGFQARKTGRNITLRKDWEDVKFNLMIEILKSKFVKNPKLGKILKSTGNNIIIEDTTGRHDNLWGDCLCPKCINIPGENLLGKALMEVRKDLFN